MLAQSNRGDAVGAAATTAGKGVKNLAENPQRASGSLDDVSCIGTGMDATCIVGEEAEAEPGALCSLAVLCVPLCFKLSAQGTTLLYKESVVPGSLVFARCNKLGRRAHAT